MPPAGGKSLCYEIPALILEGTALVLSPYADLVREQAEELQGRGIPAMALCGSSRKAERMEAFGKMAAGSSGSSSYPRSSSLMRSPASQGRKSPSSR